MKNTLMRSVLCLLLVVFVVESRTPRTRAASVQPALRNS